MTVHAVERFGADYAKTDHDRERAGDAARRQRLFEREPRQDHAAERGAGRLNDGAVAERDIDVADVAQERQRQPAEHGERGAAAPADAGEVADAIGDDHRDQSEARPDIAVQGDDERRQPDQDAVARGDEPDRPTQRRAGPAQNAQRGFRFHGAE